MSGEPEHSSKTPHRGSHFKRYVDSEASNSSSASSQHHASPGRDPLAPVGYDPLAPADNDPLAPVGHDPLAPADYDPFVSTEDPYPYANLTQDQAPGTSHAGAGDTDEFLVAAIESEQVRQNGSSGVGQAEDVRPYYDVERYRSTKHRGGGVGRIALIIASVLVVVLTGVAIAVSIFVANIDARLSANVTEELRDQLTAVVEPSEPFYMLLLGVDKDQSRWEGDDSEDYGSDESAYRSDSIMLCRVDPPNTKVTMVSIHRDTLIDLGENGKQKINAAYSIGGPAYATEVISEFADVPISHYAEVDLDRFISIVELVGGVTVNLPVPVYDPDYTGLDLPAGEQTLSGEQAALLCRCRHGYDQYGDGDRFRAANQRMVFSAVIKKVLTSDPATIASTISAMADSVTTDMTVGAILELAMQMKDLNVDTDIMTGMEPTDGVLIDGTWYEMCLTEQWQKMMSRVREGLSPYDEEQGEYDSTAGIAGGVGEEGHRAEQAAIANDRAEAIAEATGGGAPDESAGFEEIYYEEEAW